MLSHLKGKPLARDETNKFKSVIEILEKDPRSYDFLVPVDYVSK